MGQFVVQCVFIYLGFYVGSNSVGYFCGHRKSVHTVGQGSVL